MVPEPLCRLYCKTSRESFSFTISLHGVINKKYSEKLLYNAMYMQYYIKCTCMDVLNTKIHIRPLQVILWFLVHRPHQILFLDFYDFYLIISTTHAQNGLCGTK